MKKPIEVSILDYKLESKYMVKGYYYFEIKVIYEDELDNLLKRRYGKIRELYKTLLLKCPGCLIPKIPSKTFVMKYFHITDEERLKIKSNIEKFLKYLIKHPILKENKFVLNFFYEGKPMNQNLNINKMKTEDEDDDDDDSGELINLNKNKDKDEDNNEKDNNGDSGINLDDFEVIEKEDYKDLFKDEEENELLNMFLEEENNKNKGLFSASKDILSSAYKYLMIYPDENNNEVNKNIGVNSGETSIILSGSSKFQENNFDFIKLNYKELGESMEVSEYGKDIMRICEGIDYLIKNFINEANIKEKKTKSLNSIINIFNEVKKIDNQNNIKKNLNEKNSNKKEENNNEFEDIEKNEKNIIEEKENQNTNKEKWEVKILEADINKIKEYSSINNKFINDDLKPAIEQMIEYKTTVEGLLDIFYRKKNHIQFLMKLQSQYTESEKRKNLTEENDPNKKLIENDINFLRNKIDLEKKFINKLNENLKYELNKFKEEKGNKIYTFINDLYKNNYLRQREIYNILNKEISFDSDSDNSSKIKGETLEPEYEINSGIDQNDF